MASCMVRMLYVYVMGVEHDRHRTTDHPPNSLSCNFVNFCVDRWIGSIVVSSLAKRKSKEPSIPSYGREDTHSMINWSSWIRSQTTPRTIFSDRTLVTARVSLSASASLMSSWSLRSRARRRSRLRSVWGLLWEVSQGGGSEEL